jgi:hypothetical protein
MTWCVCVGGGVFGGGGGRPRAPVRAVAHIQSRCGPREGQASEAANRAGCILAHTAVSAAGGVALHVHVPRHLQ